MKKFAFIALVASLLCLMPVFAAIAASEPQPGGTMMIVSAGGPKVIGYYPEMGPADHSAAFPGLECMMEMGEERKMIPWLAESVDIDEKNLTMTFHLRKGVKFHDGSDFNAEAAAWNYQLLKDTKKLQFNEMIKSIEATDPHTLVLHLTGYHNQLEYSFGWVAILSKKAFETNGKEWCRTHFVGTGPFEQVDWKRDVHFKWKKFEGYWQKGFPYLDAIEYRYIPDSVTGSALMQAKDADIWLTPTAKDQAELEKMGFVRKAYWSGLPSIVVPNTKNPNGPMANPKVREAVEYAIDKAAVAKVVGFGYYTPLKMLHPEGEWAYDPKWPGRPYNPEKARQLLKEAGYPNGLELELLAFAAYGGGLGTAEALQALLSDVGIKLKVDMADPGRYFGSLFGGGWKDLILGFCGIDYNSLGTIMSWYGHAPRTVTASYQPTEKLLDLSRKSILVKTDAEKAEYARQISLELSENSLIIPLFNIPAAFVQQPYVHTSYLKMGLVRWPMHDMWKEKK